MALCIHQLSTFISWHWGLGNGWVLLEALGLPLERGACMRDENRFFVDIPGEAVVSQALCAAVFQRTWI